MSGCDQSTFGGGFQSEENKAAEAIFEHELVYEIKDADGKVTKRRKFTNGHHAVVVKGLDPGQDFGDNAERGLGVALDRGAIESVPILGFWTVIDGSSSTTKGAEVQTPFGKRRLPLRILFPYKPPEKKAEAPTDPEILERNDE